MTFLGILLIMVSWAFGASWTYTLMIEKDLLEENVVIEEPMTPKERTLASILSAVLWPYWLYLIMKD